MTLTRGTRPVAARSTNLSVTALLRADAIGPLRQTEHPVSYVRLSITGKKRAVSKGCHYTVPVTEPRGYETLRHATKTPSHAAKSTCTRCASRDVEDLLELHKQPQVVVGQLAGDNHTAGTRREKRRGIRRCSRGVRE